MSSRHGISYAEQLKNPNWQRRRLEIMGRDNFVCKMCWDDGITLNVHHKHYIKGKMIWEYGDEELVTLCESCHKQAHEQIELFKEVVVHLEYDGPFSLNNASALLAGWAGIHDKENKDEIPYLGYSPEDFVVGVIAFNLAKANVSCLVGLMNLIDGSSGPQMTKLVQEFVAVCNKQQAEQNA